MMDANFMTENGVFDSVKCYFKKQDWDDVEIIKTFLDDGDVEFNVFLKSGNQTFMKTLSRTEFEELVRISFDNQGIIKVAVCGQSIGYVYELNIEGVFQR